MAVAEHRRPLAPDADGLGVSYAEVLAWATWLEIFTASELADAMAVDVSLAERGIVALGFHGSIEDTGDSYGGEILWRYRTFAWPPDPTEHATLPPEWRTCEQEILSPRGEPVRLWEKKVERRMRSTPGVSHQIRLRKKKWQRMQEIREERYEQQLAKAQKAPKWKRKK